MPNMLRAPSIRTQIDDFIAQGKKFLAEASESGDRSGFLKAIQEFALSYKYALLLNSKDGTEQFCAFNLGVAHIAGGDVSRGITLLKMILDHGGWPEDPEKPNKDTYKGDVYFNLADGYEKVSESENAIKCYMNALLQYDHEEDGRKVAETYLKIANQSNSHNDFSEARRNFDLASKAYMKLQDKANAVVALTCQINAGLSDRTFSSEECIRLLNYCCNLCGELDSKALQGKILCEVGLMYHKLGCLVRGLLCFEKCVKLCENTHFQRRAVAVQNAGAILNRLGRYEEAIPKHVESARLHGALTNRNAQGQSFCNLGFAYSQFGNYEESREAYLHALKAFEDTGDRQGQWQCHEGLGTIGYNQGRMDKAVEHFNNALACQTKAMADGSRQRVLNKLMGAMKFGRRKNKDTEGLTEENGNLSERRLDKRVKDSSSDDDVLDSKPSTSIPRRSSKRRRPKSLDRGRRQYADESNRPVRQVARGISNLTQYSNPFAEDQTYIPDSDSEADIPDFLSDVRGAARSPSSMGGGMFQEKGKRKKIRGLVQASTMPINALTVAENGAHTPESSAQKLSFQEAIPRANQTADTVGFPENSSRGKRSSSHEDLANRYKEQLAKIEEDSSEEEDESYTSVTSNSTSSSSASDDETDGNPERTMRIRTYENNDLANAPSLQIPSSDGRSPGSKHPYAKVRTAANKDVTVPKEVSNATYDQIPRNTGDSNSGEDIPPLLSIPSPKNDEELERTSIASEGGDEMDPVAASASYTPPTPNVPPPLPPRREKKKPKEKSNQSRSCMIM